MEAGAARASTDTPLKLVLEGEGRKQTWLASRLGVHPTTVWGWVQGYRIPDEETRNAVAALLGRDIAELWPNGDSQH